MEWDLIGICVIAFLIAIVICCIFLFICFVLDDINNIFNNYNIEFLIGLIPLIVGVCSWVGFTFLGVGLNTNNHKAYIQSYLIQKQTIEMSIDNDNLSGLERIELVNKATELNGELAKRKVYIKYWNAGVFDNTLYDNIEFIDLN